MRVVAAATALAIILNLAFLATAGAELNQDLNDTPESVIILWTDGPTLKAINLTFFPEKNGPVGIVSVPKHTLIDSERGSLTAEDFYYRYGRENLVRQLEKLFKTSIGAFISVDQRTLVNISGIIGRIDMNGKKTTLVDVFEGNYINGPVNLQVEIRQLAGAMITPALLLKIPKVVWIFSSQVDSDIGPRHLMAFYRVIRYRGPEVLQKKAVPGQILVNGSRKYHRVNPDAWTRTLKEVTS
ncbi:hypothetical protein IT084_04240 [Desulfallas sp. Bu1-1]|uniref:hypothetical protein n=1 Tax=Desulfallas sp. Bu1-1 TaxID=2787620 RepID=UPI00189DD62F|nr:hypothetical protein [Desulfallas sp. Bu1-1]MBF7082184.1 hypothetical protein [Desulfallas sp. Bu1-1]